MFKTRLQEHQQRIEESKRQCGRSYCKQYLDYICVDSMGNLIKPGYVTSAFPVLLKKNGLRKIRYHDLRYSCASLLLANGVPMKQIQIWLGHSTFSTTADIYSHLDFTAQIASGVVMDGMFDSSKRSQPTQLEEAAEISTLCQ